MSKPKTEGSRRDFMTSAGAATGLAALATLFGGSKIVNAQELGINAMGPTPEELLSKVVFQHLNQAAA
jgi:nicotinic acid phosphoribosyltransferase